MAHHNSYTIKVIQDGIFRVESHNFPEFSAKGYTEQEALDKLNRKLIHYWDNDPKGFEQKIKDRTAKGLQCACGLKLEEPPLAIYNPRKIRTFANRYTKESDYVSTHT